MRDLQTQRACHELGGAKQSQSAIRWGHAKNNFDLSADLLPLWLKFRNLPGFYEPEVGVQLGLQGGQMRRLVHPIPSINDSQNYLAGLAINPSSVDSIRLINSHSSMLAHRAGWQQVGGSGHRRERGADRDRKDRGWWVADGRLLGFDIGLSDVNRGASFADGLLFRPR